MTARVIRFLRLTCSRASLVLWTLLSATPAFLSAQEADGSATRLQTLRNTYQSELRKLQEPLVEAYLRQLEALASQSPSVADQHQIRDEILRLTTLLEKGEVIRLETLKAATESEAPTPPPDRGPLAQALMVLGPALASEIDPPVSDASGAVSVPIQSIQWNIESLPAGTYEVMMQAALTGEIPRSTKLDLLVDDQTLTRTLGEDQRSLSEDDFHLVRIGRLALRQDLENQPLTLRVRLPEDHAEGQPAPRLELRQILLTQALAAPPR